MKQPGGLLLAIGKMKPKGFHGSEEDETETKDEGSDEEMSMGLVSASEDIIDAVKEGDAEKLSKALKMFLVQCKEYKDEESMEDSE